VAATLAVEDIPVAATTPAATAAADITAKRLTSINAK